MIRLFLDESIIGLSQKKDNIKLAKPPLINTMNASANIKTTFLIFIFSIKQSALPITLYNYYKWKYVLKVKKL